MGMQSGILNRLHVDNYRCLVNFDCRFEARQLILGGNGSGKSTVFDVLGLLRDFCVMGVSPDERFVGRTRTRWQDVPEQRFELDVTCSGSPYRLSLVIDTYGHPGRPRVKEELVTCEGHPVFRFAEGEVHLFNDRYEHKVQYPFDWHRSALATITERPENTKLSWFKRWLGGLLYVSPDPRRMSGVADQEAKWPDQYLTNFADWYRHVRLESATHEYVRQLGEVITGLEDLALEDVGERRREILVKFGGAANGRRSDPSGYLLSELSEGQRVLIGLYAILHFALKPGRTICFDEPDNFIALREIQPWLSEVFERTEDEQSPAQVLIASHHPELLNRLAFKEGILLDRPDGRHTRVRRFADPTDTGLTAAELVARGWENA
ncbi:MAG: AAA family ATPase [Phycisphaerales bacterium]|nr:AAA family ATPase [Phycisphaerales bacterium]